MTESTFDAYLYQLVENKQKFIGQIMTSKSPVRSAADVDETALSYAEIKALATGNPLIKERMDLEMDVSKLKMLKASHLSQRYALEDSLLKVYPQQIKRLEERIEGYKADIGTAERTAPPDKDAFAMTVSEQGFMDKAKAGEAILAATKKLTSPTAVPLGSYRGFPTELSFDAVSRNFHLTLVGSLKHDVELGGDALGNITRIDNVLERLPSKLNDCKDRLENTHTQQQSAQADVDKPFPQEGELEEKSKRLAELDALLNMDEKDDTLLEDGIDDPDKSERENAPVR